MAYVIGSQKGKDIAKNMKTGETYKASDGSTWTKKSDGSVSVQTSSGQTFNNAYTPTSSGSSGGSSGGSSSKGSSGGTTSGGSKGGNSQYTGSSNAVITNNDTQQAIKDKMNANSIAWWSADENERKRLEEENRNYAAILGGSVSFDSGTGTWSGTAAGVENGAGSSSGNTTFLYATPQPTYNNQYDPQIEALLNEILNRDDFSYDVANDPLYQQYAQMYRREGDRAMENTLAEAATSAGGMNSYAITAAQQAANNYASQLNDKIPELYQLAYDMYLADKESKVQDLGLLQSMDSMQYNRYRDTMADWKDDKQFTYNMYRDDIADSQWNKTFDYNAFVDNRNFAYDSNWRDKEWTANQGQLDLENSRYDQDTAKEEVWKYINMGVTPSADLIAKAGMSESDVNLAVAAVQAELAKKNTKSGGGNYKYVPDDDADLVIEDDDNGGKVTDLSNVPIYQACDEIYATQGKEAVLQFLKEAQADGVVSATEYGMYYNLYKNRF